MHEMILCKLGEVVLKGLNRRSFEMKLMSNLRRRTARFGRFRVYSKQSTIYVEPAGEACDLDGAYDACKRVFGIIAVARALRIPVHISHLKAMGRDNWGVKISRALAMLEQARQDNAEAMFSGHDIPAEKAAAMQHFVQEVLQACRKKRNPLQRFADRWFHIWY